jgi:hypothetical protein
VPPPAQVKPRQLMQVCREQMEGPCLLFLSPPMSTQISFRPRSELFGHRNEGASVLSDGINELSSVGCDQHIFMPLLCSMSM